MSNDVQVDNSVVESVETESTEVDMASLEKYITDDPVVDEQEDEGVAAGEEEVAEVESNDEEAPAEEPEIDPKLEKSWEKLAEREEMARQGVQLYRQFEELNKKVKSNPMEALNAFGLTLDNLTEYLENGGFGEEKPDPVKQLEQKISNMEAEKAAAEQQRMAQEYRSGLDKYLEENAAKYPSIAAKHYTNVVWDVIVQQAQQGEVLTYDQAATAVEDYLVDLLGNSNVAPVETEQPTQKKPKATRPTLTNSLESERTVETPDFSEEQRIANALKVMEGIDPSTI